VILGIHLGDSNDEFRNKCMALNQLQLLTQGPRGSVLYQLKDTTAQQNSSDMRLLIFPSFDDNGVISNIDIDFSYSAWAPWNVAYQSDSLEVKLRKLLMIWYDGNDFVYAEMGEKKVPVKVDGNRRVILKVKDAQTVTVMVQDMLHPKFNRKK
jgi:hypothetical protein